MNKKVLAELKQLHEQRGVITRSQVEYSRTEIRALNDIYPLIKPADEVRPSNSRTLDSYISVNGLSLKNIPDE
jgi:hypothetical protein